MKMTESMSISSGHQMAQRQMFYFLLSVRRCVQLPVASRLCSSSPQNVDPAAENKCLLESLSSLGVDLSSARRRHPGVLKRALTNEQGLARFLQSKGADAAAVASIISRFPRCITRSSKHLQERWSLWRSIFQSDGEMVEILSRSPESFFRSSDNKNLEENITFLKSLGITPKDLHRLLTTAPRTFSNSVALNRNMVELLQSVCASLGGDNEKEFARIIISKNLYIFIRSTNRIRANVDFLLSEMKLSDSEAQVFLQSHGALILDLSHESLKKNFQNLRLKLRSLGCGEEDLRKMILKFSLVLFMSAQLLNTKLDCFLDAGINIQQLILKPKVLDFSVENIRRRLEQLRALDYDFQKQGIAVLDMSNKRFQEKIRRLENEL